MNVLFIGGTGNISSACVDLLLRRGHAVSVLTRGRSPAPAGCQAVVGDRNDLGALRAAAARAKPDVVVNFLGFDVPDVESDFAAFSGIVRQYVFISSTTVYAKPHRRIPLTEETPRGNPFSEYARKKQRCEEWLEARARDSGLPVTIVRPSHTYSETWIPNPVASAGYTFAARMLAGKPVFVHDDGQGLWTLTAATDFAVGLAGLLGRDDALGEAVHITSDEVLTWNQIYREVALAIGVSSPVVRHIPTEAICAIAPDLTPKFKGDKSEPGVFDNAKIKWLVPDYGCRISFREGIRRSAAWYREHPGRAVADPQVDAAFDRVIGCSPPA